MFGMGAPPPSRSKSTRQSSSAAKSSSRRQSAAVDDSGLISPPPEGNDREMSAKAAKVMGVGRSKSTREKGTRRIPDPYAIDSDDMIIVDGPEDSAKDIEEPKERKKSSRSKRQSAYMSGALGPEDEMMPDAPRAMSGAEDLDFVERPSPVRRTTSSAKKPGIMGGILGAFSSRPAPDRRTSKVYESEDGARRKRGSVYDDEYSKRLRRDERKVGRSSRKPSDGDGLTDAAPVTDAEDAEAREARRRERRERRDREAADEEARATRRREKEARAREEDEDRRREEKRARRAERETRRAEEERIAREEEKAREERRERRRERERQQRAEEEAAASRPKTDRRRSTYVDASGEDESRRIRREERRLRRSVDQGGGGDKERPRTSRRRSDYPAPAAGGDYFDARNGERSPRANPTTPLTHAIKTGGDKTASWVHSLNDSAPDPPPIERTIIDAPIHYAEDEVPDRHPLEGEDTTAREYRHRRRREQEGYGDDLEDRRRRRPRDGEHVRSSDGSSGQRGGIPMNSIGYNDMGGRTFDGRPAMPRGESKRGSWFKKIAGL